MGLVSPACSASTARKARSTRTRLQDSTFVPRARHALERTRIRHPLHSIRHVRKDTSAPRAHSTAHFCPVPQIWACIVRRAVVNTRHFVPSGTTAQHPPRKSSAPEATIAGKALLSPHHAHSLVSALLGQGRRVQCISPLLLAFLHFCCLVF